EGKNWGIVGMGSIGRKVAGIAQALGANVSYYLREGGKLYPFVSHNLHDLLRTCQIVSIHAPLNAQTQGMIGASELALLQDGAVLLNLGRGGIVDEAALANELKKRPLYAGLDVFAKEPLPKENPLLSSEIPSERLLLTPHIAWGYAQSRERLIAGIVENIKSLN
ncbi:MAG: hydroxyacid dehydrogenase, partial [Helicobacter sp.]|nr:hydroxyacid dehydrogenase [Helicobacter sp.]